MVGGLAVNLVESALSLFAARVVAAGAGGANVPAGVSQIMIASDFGIKPSAAVEQQLLTTSMASDDLRMVRSVPATVEEDTDENESEEVEDTSPPIRVGRRTAESLRLKMKTLLED